MHAQTLGNESAESVGTPARFFNFNLIYTKFYADFRSDLRFGCHQSVLFRYLTFVDLARQWSTWVWGYILRKYFISNTDTPDLWLDIPLTVAAPHPRSKAVVRGGPCVCVTDVP